MKKIYLSILLTGILFLFSAPLKAQVHFNLNINIGNQPVWGPVGYDYVEYYYLPDIEVYYSVPQGVYFYFDGGSWVSTAYLPVRYRDYDIYHGYKVVVNESKPWRHHDNFRKKYAKFRGRHDQMVIRDSHDERYYVIKDHPQHSKWRGNNKYGDKFERGYNDRDDERGNGNKHENYGGGNHGNGNGNGNGNHGNHGNGHGKRK